MRIPASSSLIRLPLTSTMAVCSVPVNVNGVL